MVRCAPLCFAWLALFGAAAGPLRAEPSPRFNRDIRPILSENCFACHGFDAKKREADLRLDTVEGAFADLGGYAALVPGDPEKSEVWRRLISDDSDEVMPPPGSHKSLSEAEKNTVRRWIEEGAVYQRHWSLEPPVRPEVPPGGAAPIDAFLESRLAEESLTFQPEADRATLIRRVAFTLTGLPPTLAEIEAFEGDLSPGAYEAMVDRYLASPRFGEEMARHWLDLARYGDTHGLHLDNERSMWAYRDWVVAAFNRNLPFDRFTLWQLAGDLLPEATAEQRLATGFLRCNVTTSEGGAISEEYRHLYAIDRAATLTTAWLGLTGACAQCHDHKFDPLGTKDFYSLYAFFYSAADPPMDGNIAATAPALKLPGPGQDEALAAAVKAEAASLRVLESATLAPYREPGQDEPAIERVQVIFDDDFSLGAELRNTSRNPAAWIDQPGFGAPSGRRVLRQRNGRFFENRIVPTLVPITVPTTGARFEIEVRPDPLSPPSMIAILVNDRRIFWGDSAALTAFNAGSPKEERSAGPMPVPGKWTKLSFASADLGLAPGAAVNSLSVQQSGGDVAWDRFALVGTTDPSRDPLVSFRLWWSRSGGKKPTDLPPALATAYAAGPDKNTDNGSREALLKFYRTRVAHAGDESLASRRRSWEEARVARAAADAAIPLSLVYADLPEPLETFVAERGQYDKHGERVVPAIPAQFGPFTPPADGRRLNRLDLARWLISEGHPLTARVAANRLWQQVFGTGLVSTSHDFGSQGEPPSHPELLDWLALSFAEEGWDVKRFVRRLVTSRAFRQRYQADAALLGLDPDNRLLARAPRLRLDAEQIRDNALFVGGLLDTTRGGPGVRPYQPPNIWEPVGYGDSNTRYYVQDHGEALYRRSLYCFLKRTAPPPFMSNFDAPNREQSCTRRERNNTPMQALQLMNDVQFFEAARALAERALTEGGTDDTSRLRWLFRTVLSRAPDEKESGLLADSLARQREHAAADLKAAGALVSAGESTPRTVAPAAETAAWTMVANLVLNLDETVTRN